MAQRGEENNTSLPSSSWVRLRLRLRWGLILHTRVCAPINDRNTTPAGTGKVPSKNFPKKITRTRIQCKLGHFASMTQVRDRAMKPWREKNFQGFYLFLSGKSFVEQSHTRNQLERREEFKPKKKTQERTSDGQERRTTQTVMVCLIFTCPHALQAPGFRDTHACLQPYEHAHSFVNLHIHACTHNYTHCSYCQSQNNWRLLS